MNNDLISREALKEVINDLFRTGEYDCNSVLNAIDNAPTVEPTFGLFKEMLCAECEERPQGEWIYLPKDDAMKVECPFCHERKCCISNYCDYCGAKMKGGAENDK